MAVANRKGGPPDFVGVGAQRSGTTWWFRLLLQHPAIRRPKRAKRKELHFFDRFCGRPMTDADVSEYHGLFRPAAGSVTGEWTPRYMHDPWTPPLLRRAAPDAKLLVLLRDPVERFRSGFAHELGRKPGRKHADVATDAILRGRYASQLAQLWEHFDREQVLVLQYERCRQDTPGQYARTLRFLGVDDAFEPAGTGELRGTTTESRKDPLWPELAEAITATLEADVRELAAMVPDLDLELWPRFAPAGAVHRSG